MNFVTELLPSTWLWVSHFIFFSWLSYALWRAPWQHFFNPDDTNVFFFSCLALFLLWQLGGGITAGMEFHLLLITTITLMFGWQFATLAIAIIQLCLTLTGYAEWATFSINALCNGIVPMAVTYGVYWLALIGLPRHFFIYVYICAFLGGALSMLASRLVGMSILLSNQTYHLADLGDEPLFIIVMLFPEAFINGMLITLLIVYKPQWVSSFSDKRYLYGK